VPTTPCSGSCASSRSLPRLCENQKGTVPLLVPYLCISDARVLLMRLRLQQAANCSQTNTEPGAVATGSSNNKLISNRHGPGRYCSPFRICRPTMLSVRQLTQSQPLPVLILGCHARGSADHCPPVYVEASWSESGACPADPTHSCLIRGWLKRGGGRQNRLSSRHSFQMADMRCREV
jgi:hypothetical protein